MSKLSKKTKDLMFMAGFAIYLLVLYIDSAKLSASSRALPMGIMVTSVIIIALKLLVYVFPNKLKFLDDSIKKSMTKSNNDGDDVGVAVTVVTELLGPAWGSEILIVSLIMLWLATFPVGIYFIGFLYTMFIWMFVFLIGVSRVKWLKALYLSVGTFVSLYVLFVVFLDMVFPLGILFE